MRLCFLLSVFALVDSMDVSYEDEDMAAVEAAVKSLEIRCVTFLVKTGDNPGLVRHLKRFSDTGVFYAVANSTTLNHSLLTNEMGRHMMFVTKEKVNLTFILINMPGSILLSFAESLDQVRHFYAPIHTNLYLAIPGPDGIDISRAFNLKRKEELSLESVGRWRSGQFVKRTRPDFRALSLDMIYTISEEQCRKMEGKHVLDRMECYHQKLIGFLADRVNFTVNRIKCPNMEFPYNYPNGSLSSMFSTLVNNEVDISAGSYIVNRWRHKLYGFVWPTFTARSRMYVKLKNSKSSWRAYLRPLSGFLWTVIVIWIIGAGVLIQIFEEFRGRKSTFRFPLVPRLIKSIYSSLQVFCNQGVEEMPKWYSSRTIYLITFIFSLILYQVYSAILISSLMVVVPEIPFTTFRELMTVGSHKILTVNSGFHHFYVKQVAIILKGKIDHLLVKDHELPGSIPQAIAMICDSETLGFLEYRENFVQYDIPCKVTEIPLSLIKRNIGIALPRHSPFQKILNRELNLIRSSGLIHRMKIGLLSTKKLLEKDTSNEDYMPVTIDYLVSIFFILGSGFILSSSILIFEILLGASNRYYESRTYRASTKREKLTKKYLNGVNMILHWFSVRFVRSEGGHYVK